uniref:Uncharacterized protein n=1 Tax=Chromera velia CCMP2878 TaxID=1169474 RepID=A0A0G4IAL3_9ALVE|eukprot:Cvel_12609.t1-p1 / transcript=Cvel_12609.t1 / gene=Cvel_12609 / organism=Chromera_velia_CCMP2878 / gene_product=hypothetical protein / transcript_product=hypothetical protein / location=Cvel_scaffold832:26727-27518(+) / protein_length=264 / sequence_SO=supercontig / SO=protein_coding / is_pseudo=false
MIRPQKVLSYKGQGNPDDNSSHEVITVRRAIFRPLSDYDGLLTSFFFLHALPVGLQGQLNTLAHNCKWNDPEGVTAAFQKIVQKLGMDFYVPEPTIGALVASLPSPSAPSPKLAQFVAAAAGKGGPTGHFPNSRSGPTQRPKYHKYGWGFHRPEECLQGFRYETLGCKRPLEHKTGDCYLTPRERVVKYFPQSETARLFVKSSLMASGGSPETFMSEAVSTALTVSVKGVRGSIYYNGFLTVWSLDGRGSIYRLVLREFTRQKV